MNSYYYIALATITPAILTVIFTILDKRTVFKNISYAGKQMIYGFAFGGLAILSTHYGVPLNGAQINVRDGAVLTAGLLFGSPAGIIAGTIGAVERYIATDLWGIGSYTQVACTVSTFLAGIYSAFLRKVMFDESKPSWPIALAIGMVMEVVHMSMVFITNMNDTVTAASVVKSCSTIMIVSNMVAVGLAALVSSLMNDGMFKKKQEAPSISHTIQGWLLVCVAVALIFTSVFMYQLQTGIANTQTKQYLSLGIEEVINDIQEASDSNLIALCHTVADGTKKHTLQELSDMYDLAEISIIDENGIITESTNPELIGFDMSSGKQAAEFLCLLDNQKEYVQPYGPITYDSSIERKYAGVTYGNGFIQVGYDAKEFQKDLLNKVKISALNKHIGGYGYVMIGDELRWVVSAPKDCDVDNLDNFGFNKDGVSGDIYRATIDGIDSFYMFKRVEGYYVVSVLPVSEAYDLRNTALFANAFMEVLVFAVMFALIYILVKEVVVNKIHEINHSLLNITRGRLDEVVDVRTNQEFVYLSDDINHTVDTLKKYIEEAKTRIDAELKYASEIQYSSLPHQFPTHENYELYALMAAAKEVGGDFYDFYTIDNNETLHIIIADVSGKGIPGAMFMMRAKTELHSQSEKGLPINEVFTSGNNHLCEGNDAEMFVTAWEGRMNLSTGDIEYANAGHNPPIIIHSDGKAEFVNAKASLVLGAMEAIQYKLLTLHLNEGDTLFLYTDGVVEATNLDKELYGNDRLLDVLQNANNIEMSKLCARVIIDVNQFVGEAEQFDDITMVAIKYLGPSDKKQQAVEVATVQNNKDTTNTVEATNETKA